jgi:hypothetical protein
MTPMDETVGSSEKFLVRSAAQTCVYWTRVWIIGIILLVLAGLAYGWWSRSHDGSTAEAKYAWAQLLPVEGELHGGRLVRAIVTEGGGCPTLQQDGKPMKMTVRPSRVRAAFPIVLCEAQVAEASDVWVGRRHLPVRPTDPRDIVAIGDTGCRVVYYDNEPQRCGSESGWPFATLAQRAAAAAGEAPSIVLHVGDFHYRENPCADTSVACGGTPYGDNWATWEEEFFKPADPLLRAAPWIIVRGNHESCARAGAGWLYLFALPNVQYDNACKNDLPPYRLDLGRTADGRSRVLVVLDTADDATPYDLAKRCAKYQGWIDGMAWTDGELWLAVHQPLWLRDPGSSQNAKALPTNSCEDKSTASAVDGIRARLAALAGKRTARLILSGDIHLFELFQPRDATRPIQLVVGNGGTKLDRLQPQGDSAASGDVNRPVTSLGVDGIVSVTPQFGFTRLHLDQSTWSIKMIGVDGKTLASCSFSEGPAAPPADDKPPPCAAAPKQD